MWRDPLGHGYSFLGPMPLDKGQFEGILRYMAMNGRQNGLDDANIRLIAELQQDARLSFAELGRRVGLSSPAVAERLARLEETGVITGYHAQVDPRALGFTLGAIVRIRPAPRELHKVAELAQRTPEVVECHRITGEDCFFMKAWVRDVEHLEEVIDQFVIYGQTTTSIMQKSPVPPRPLSADAQMPGQIVAIRR
jgi:Lrp/AsnC family transcriptional regulator, leucine-responsive regulatory protein